eukprot:6866366-Prymnesium_polylepis.1
MLAAGNAPVDSAAVASAVGAAFCRTADWAPPDAERTREWVEVQAKHVRASAVTCSPANTPAASLRARPAASGPVAVRAAPSSRVWRGIKLNLTSQNGKTPQQPNRATARWQPRTHTSLTPSRVLSQRPQPRFLARHPTPSR